MQVNYDHLPEGEIKESIIKTFPTPPENEDLRRLVQSHLNENNSAENIKYVVSQMGMDCESGKNICVYNGYVRTKATGGYSGSGRAKHIYRITMSPESGINSLNIEKQIIEDKGENP